MDSVPVFNVASACLILFIVFSFMSIVSYVLSSDVEDNFTWIMFASGAVIFLIAYFIFVYRNSKKIKDSKEVECGEEFKKFSVWF